MKLFAALAIVLQAAAEDAAPRPFALDPANYEGGYTFDVGYRGLVFVYILHLTSSTNINFLFHQLHTQTYVVVRWNCSSDPDQERVTFLVQVKWHALAITRFPFLHIIKESHD